MVILQHADLDPRLHAQGCANEVDWQVHGQVEHPGRIVTIRPATEGRGHVVSGTRITPTQTRNKLSVHVCD